jgi:ketosteroid isomerase-like protein
VPLDGSSARRAVAVPDQLSDRIAVSEVLDDYARGIDSRDWDLVLSVFTDDAELDYTAFGSVKGHVKEVVDWLQDALAAFVLSQHHITNRHITIDGDEAVVSAELLAIMGMPSGDGKMSMMYTGGQYNDRLVRTAEGWKISKRICDRGWLASGPDATGPTGPV